MNLEDVAYWPCGTWCFGDEIEEFLTMMSDDYLVLGYESPAWKNLMEQEEM
jgi:hypothetical protein